MQHTRICVAVLAIGVGSSAVVAGIEPESVYLWDANMTVELAPGNDPDPFNNVSTEQSLANIIDLPSADAGELHNQSTHVWTTGDPLGLRFDLLVEYDLTTIHFWNYHSEGFDVDDIDFTFFDANMDLVGTINDVEPALGNATGSDSDPIFAEDIPLNFPSKVQFVDVVLSGTNTQVDFNNLGFTGTVTVIPEPATLGLLGGLGLTLLRRR
ncbi:MAG: PEP-CTERM sorting domain-containing protein [Planctomycetota bacterium]